MRMWRNEALKYVYCPTGRDELYDLTNDPGELKNVVSELPYTDALSECRRLMGSHMAEIRDPLSPPDFSWPAVRWG
jgi:arylsulfatase A-like enzyme